MRPYIETGGMRRDHPFCQLNCRLSYGSIAEAASFCYNEREVKTMAELDKRKFGTFAPDFWAAAERPAALLLTLGGLVVPMYLVGKRYE